MARYESTGRTKTYIHTRDALPASPGRRQTRRDWKEAGWKERHERRPLLSTGIGALRRTLTHTIRWLGDSSSTSSVTSRRDCGHGWPCEAEAGVVRTRGERVWVNQSAHVKQRKGKTGWLDLFFTGRRRGYGGHYGWRHVVVCVVAVTAFHLGWVRASWPMGDSWVAMGQGQPSGGGVTVTLCVGGDEDKSRGSPVLSGMQVRTLQAARLETVNRTGSRAVWCAMMDEVRSPVQCLVRTPYLETLKGPAS